MSARSTMTMRATIERATTTAGKNPWGQPKRAVLATVVGTVPCRAWSKDKRDVDDAGKDAVIEGVAVMVPSTTTIKKHDRLTIRDRAGAVQFDGPVYVLTKRRIGGSGSGPSHRQLFCRRNF